MHLPSQIVLMSGFIYNEHHSWPGGVAHLWPGHVCSVETAGQTRVPGSARAQAGGHLQETPEEGEWETVRGAETVETIISWLIHCTHSPLCAGPDGETQLQLAFKAIVMFKSLQAKAFLFARRIVVYCLKITKKADWFFLFLAFFSPQK